MSREQNMWNERYQEEAFVYGKEPNAFIAQIGPQLQPGRTLTIAEGEGRNAVYLAGLGHEVTYWDYAVQGMEKLSVLAQERGVHVEAQLVDLSEAPWEADSWDHVVCIYGHFPPTLRMNNLYAVKEAVKPGGMFIAEVYSTYQLSYGSGGPKNVDLLYRLEDFTSVFEDWRILHLFMGEMDRHEGSLHQGRSHVIQFWGQKR